MLTELYKNDWCSIFKIENEKLKIKPFYFKRLNKLNHGLVAILPYRYSKLPSFLNKEYLVVEELRPSWCVSDILNNTLQTHLASITGGVNKNERIEDAILRELKEETGYEAEGDSLEYLGWSFVEKDSDSKISLFSIDLTNCKQGIISKDGTELEKYTEPKWISESQISDLADPLVAQMYVKLNKNF